MLDNRGSSRSDVINTLPIPTYILGPIMEELTDSLQHRSLMRGLSTNSNLEASIGAAEESEHSERR